MKKLKRLSKSTIIALVAIALISGAVAAAYMITRQVQVGVTVIPSGDLIVTPASIEFGEMIHGSSSFQSITFENTTPEPLVVSWNDTVTDGVTVMNVDTTESGFTLAAGDTDTKSIEFIVSLTVPYGVYSNLVWNVYGETP